MSNFNSNDIIVNRYFYNIICAQNQGTKTQSVCSRPFSDLETRLIVLPNT